MTLRVVKTETDRHDIAVVAVRGSVLAEHVSEWFAAFRPRERMTLSEWAEKHARLEDGSRYHPFPFQRDIMDAFTEPGIRQISVIKSSRIGYSMMVKAYLGYCIDQSPSKVLVYQPTIEDAEDFSKDDVGNITSWPAVARHADFEARSPDNTLRSKKFPGGWLKVKGTNSPKEFRRLTADKVVLEEVDGYPQDSGVEGDPVALAFKRALTSDDPLRVAGSTPTVKGASKIESLVELGTLEYRYVPCPHCGHMQRLVFGDGTGPGLRWEPQDKPARAWYRCEQGCDIEEFHKEWMDENGEFRATFPENWPHRSFVVWGAYSQFAGAAWLEIAKEFVAVKDDPGKLKPFVNQVLGESFAVRGEAPEWRRLYERREEWDPRVLPDGVLVLQRAFDVQKDRLEGFVWGFGRDGQSWLVDHQVFGGSPFDMRTWEPAADWCREVYTNRHGVALSPQRTAVDTGYATTEAAAFCRRFHGSHAMPVKGASTKSAAAVGLPQSVDLTVAGKKKRRGLKVWSVGDHVLKLQFYGLLNLDPPTDEELAEGRGFPPGYVHLPKWTTEEHCKQLTAESYDNRRGEWQKHHANEQLDGWKYCRAAMIACGADRWSDRTWDELEHQLGFEPGKRSEPATWQGAAETPSAPASKEQIVNKPSRRRRRTIGSGYV